MPAAASFENALRGRPPERRFAVTALLWTVVVALVAVGIVGTVLPWLPGVPLVFGALLLAAWIDDFQRVSAFTVGVLAALTVVAVLVDLAASTLGAERVGASGRAVAGAALGTVVGAFFGLPGLLLGPFLGAVIGDTLPAATGVARRAPASEPGSGCCWALWPSWPSCSRCSAYS